MFKVTVRIITLVAFFMLLTFGLTNTSPLKAQEKAIAIKYGQTVRSEITDQKVEINYTFEGQADDVVIVRMEMNGTQGLKTPAFIVLNGESLLIDSTKIFT